MEIVLLVILTVYVIRSVWCMPKLAPCHHSEVKVGLLIFVVAGYKKEMDTTMRLILGTKANVKDELLMLWLQVFM